MGGPTGVANAAVALGPLGLVAGREVDKFALGLEAMEPAVFTNGGNARRVVAAVFELPQALQQLGSRFPRTNQGNDAAHRGETRSETKQKARH